MEKSLGMRFVDVILPLPLSSVFTYVLPAGMCGSVEKGFRVIVPFGAKKIYTGIVVRVHDRQPTDYALKSVLEVLDTHPVLLPVQLDFWHWIADYYLCTPGDVYKAALPSGMKLESESKVMVNEEYAGDEVLSDREVAVVTLLESRGEQTVTQLQKNSADAHVLQVVRSLLDKGVLLMREEVKRTYKPRTEVHVRLSAEWLDEQRLHALLDDLKRAPKQQTLLLKYMDMAGVATALRLRNPRMLAEVSRKALAETSGTASSICKALVEKGILETYLYETGRLPNTDIPDTIGVAPLSGAQEKAFSAILQEFTRHTVCLLHGVTSSGKTEIYIHLIRQQLAKGQQVLYLVPEIALTTQLTDRLFHVFGARMGVYHSKFSDAERVEVWQKQLSDQPYDIIVGVRSSVFLPFCRLGLVIVDEEHEASYKQQDPAPRYHARNAAIVLARMTGAYTLLGTATPALETYYNVRKGKYGLVELTERYGKVQMPVVEVVDIKELQHKRRMVGPFSPRLLEEMRRALEHKEQVILFQNRRGYAPLIECHDCGWIPKCQNCDVSLTYHKGLNRLTCHYCGYTCNVPVRCPACGGTELVQRGFGTEKVEDFVRHLFPEAVVSRMDLDTTRTRASYESILNQFQRGETNVLIGTQMVTKGLDFERVSVVGILNADGMLNQPDFRSFERAFQLMAQVAGRAGRRREQGRVILQTKSPELPVIRQVTAYDFKGLYLQQMEERQMFMFPPFCRLIYVYMKHKRADVLDRLANTMASRLRAVFGTRILGPDVPPVSRVQLLYIRKIVLKAEPGIALSEVRVRLLAVRQAVMEEAEFRNAQVYYDVDPV